MSSPVSDNPTGSPTVDRFAAARNHPIVLAPGLSSPPSDVTSSLRDTFAAARNYPGGTPSIASHHIPYVDPFAAARHFVAAQATTSDTPLPADAALQNYLRAQVRPDFLGKHLLTVSKAERRQIDPAAEEAPPAKKAKINNTIPVGSRLEAFLKCAIVAQKELLAREACLTPPSACPGHCKKKHFPPPYYRCFDCFHPPTVCEDCIIRDHVHNPFHRIGVWDPALRFWQRRSLGSLDKFVLNLGHGGTPCKVATKSPRPMTLIHGQGIAQMKVQFCACPEDDDTTKPPLPDNVQLLRFGLFPGSWDIPRSAFSINGLRDYHLLSLQCQITGLDYMRFLQRSSDNVVPAETKDRSRELNNTMREFMFLRATRRAGLQPTHNLPAGSLGVLCPACPQPYKNMNPEDQSKRPEEEKYLDTFFHAVDGNFHSSQKMKPMDPSDFPLTNGGGYYTEVKEYSHFQREFKPPKKEPTTCHKFGAMGYTRFGGRISGTVGLSCARHMFLLPCGSVDLPRGEAFAYVDYCMCSGLAPYFTLCRHCSGYDINCQYRIHFKTRIKELQEQFPTLSVFRIMFFPYTLPAIGKFHAPAHTSSCRTAYSYNFLPGVGMTDGEALERIWSVFNALALRTKEMSSGHRQDVINDFHSDMNTRRLHAMPMTLSERYARAIEHEERTANYLAALEETIDDAPKLARWQQKVDEWVERVLHREEEIALEESPYEIGQAFRKSMTDRELLAKITQERSLSSESAVGMLKVVQDGLALQRERDALLDRLIPENESRKSDDLEERCQAFLNDVARWRVLLDAYLTPLVEDAIRQFTLSSIPAGHSLDSLGPEFPMRDMTQDAGDPAQGLPRPRNQRNRSEAWSEISEVVLPLPSSYLPGILSQPSMSEPVTIERNLRQVAADHALEDLRTALIGVGYLQVDKKSKQRKTHTTRAQNKIQTAQGEAEKVADEYRRHRIALLALGMQALDPRYKILVPGDVIPFSMASDRSTVGQSRQRTSWIWENFVSTVVPEDDNEDHFKDFHEEARRVHWSRSSATHTRWYEEVQLLMEEMKRTVRFFHYYRYQWETTMRREEDAGNAGAAAYARKQAHRYVRLLELCAEKFRGAFDVDTLLIELSDVD
ncbi:hypothetical protein GSI_08469 [Ganoderma sinense ZZ0214-1]|uniref:CxC2-like cysteine cluster KDZ transposase-associated domain-containing protein n=1 Tax=Ganoderma sinense ZZ0214-1 TaxID=1077348 RepID=A0A2G8S3W9_9APHY|nr:hypothetical protein GSI_08469 [Ganoderma sinense ZZ0214-1]